MLTYYKLTSRKVGKKLIAQKFACKNLATSEVSEIKEFALVR
mgnify:CR=1 FL=1|tara:strand:+ start:36 stop:161 length:126 start_codon:yes stop_codon:yes gene_type:complete